MITSSILNLRSRMSNYHGAINALILWDNRVPKRVIQMLNHLGFCASHTFQGRAVIQLGKDAVRVARSVARDPTKLKLLPYDNFNWMSRAWEVSATHGSVQHDQVSAMLVVLNQPHGPNAPTATHLADVERFGATAGTRHQMAAEDALEAILPNSSDQHTFREMAILHIAYILSEDVKCFSKFRSTLPKFHDPKAIPLHKTEQYYLPTFDQEQASTRGNMIVLRHYFLEVLALPKSVFETVMFFILGDRLTTARDRAAQDQRAVDRSKFRVDHLSSFTVISGLMHVCMNKMQNIGRNMWGTKDRDDVSLLTLRDLLPNRSNINLHKHDFYAWLRFLDAILRSLAIIAAMAALNITKTTEFDAQAVSEDEFMSLCTRIVDTYVIPSPDRLEADGIKTVEGDTVSGHAVLMMFDLMTLREMRHAIKHGHPSRILRVMKFWTPMFYAGGSYNYAHELMELQHNYHHDWPRDTADVLFAGMLVNPTGEENGFLEGDLDCEHLNLKVKGRTDEPNMTPEVLAKITPALGHVRRTTEQLYTDIGVEEMNQYHAHVRQTKDIEILVQHFIKANIFHFALDRPSEHVVVDLYRDGLHRLGGTAGGHAKHLMRHKLRLRTRHGTATDTYQNVGNMERLLDDEELADAQDHNQSEFTLSDEDDSDNLHLYNEREASDEDDDSHMDYMGVN
jgi:hypothetical protein